MRRRERPSAPARNSHTVLDGSTMMLLPATLRKTLSIILFAGAVYPEVGSGQSGAPPRADYWVYVGAESSDMIHRIRFGPGGLVVEKNLPVGELAAEMEGPHGLAISRDGSTLHLTTGHGFPDGKYWKYHLGPDTLIGPGTLLGNFPASIDISPDGMYAIAANFNLHGDMVPSSQSVVYVPTGTEVTRIVTCTMPHGSRISADGRWHYSGCMMDDQLVEIDTRKFEVSRRFSLAAGKEGPIAVTAAKEMEHDHGVAVGGGGGARKVAPVVDPADLGYQGQRHQMEPNTCSPTWAVPAPSGEKIYVACNKADFIAEIDFKQWSISRKLPTGRGPYNITLTPDGSLLLVTLKQGGGFQVFDIASGKSLAKFESSTTVTHGVVASPDSRYAFVSSEGVGASPGKLDVYDLKTLARVGSLDLALQTGGIAFWKMEVER